MNTSSNVSSRWEKIDLGIFQTLLKVILVNISDKANGIVSILISTLISIGDTSTDLYVAITLFDVRHTEWGWAVLLVDYIPNWQLIFHNISSRSWRRAGTYRDHAITLLFLLSSPFAMALFHLRWLIKFETSDNEEFNFLHHNARMSNILSGSFESPLQILILLCAWGYGKLEPPLAEATTITDSNGNQLYLGMLPGIMSLLLSTISIVKGCLEISEGRSWPEKIETIVYGVCNYAFRLPSYALAIMYFPEWALPMIPILFVAYIIQFMRYDARERKDFSFVTTLAIAPFTPFISSDQANIYQRTDIQHSLDNDPAMENKHRRILSSNLAMTTTCVLLLSNVALLLVLIYINDFKINDDVSETLRKETTISLLQHFLIPMSGITLLSNFLYRSTRSGKNVSYETSLMALDTGVYWYVIIKDDIPAKLKSISRFVGMVALLLACTSLTVLGIRAISQGQKTNTTQNMTFFQGSLTTLRPLWVLDTSLASEDVLKLLNLSSHVPARTGAYLRTNLV